MSTVSTLTQRLAMLAMEAGKLEQALKSVSKPASDKLKLMKEQIVQLSQDVHGISRRLHPAILEDLGLVEAIRSQCDGFEDREGTQVEFTVENVPEEINDAVAFCLYRITQESFRNIAKHAKAESVCVSLLGENGNIELSIEDTGVGFDPKKESAGLGLASMAERVRLVQGTLVIQSATGRGTHIQVRAPLIAGVE